MNIYCSLFFFKQVPTFSSNTATMVHLPVSWPTADRTFNCLHLKENCSS